LLEIVRGLFDAVVAEAVMDEVTSQDLVRAYPDAALISRLASEGAIKS